MTFPLFWWQRRPRACAEDRPGRRRTLERLQFPLGFSGRIALIEAGMSGGRNIRQFLSTDAQRLNEYAPGALVAPLDVALSLADRKVRGLFDLPSLDTAIVVLTGIEDSPLADHHRDLLWRAFRVPVFEQVRNADGVVFARECETHDGLHLSNAGAVLPEWAELVRDNCECGSDLPRMRKMRTVALSAAAKA